MNTLKKIMTVIILLLSITIAHAQTKSTKTDKAADDQLKLVYDNYFSLKDALVKTDSKTASIKAKDLLTSINAVKTESLKPKEQAVWTKVLRDLSVNSKSISETQDIKKQRALFKIISKRTYELIKVANTETPTYYQYCPMADANWLSKENTVKNPYYGSQMLTCGRIVETIK